MLTPGDRRRALAIDAGLAAGLAALTVASAVALAPRGFNAGFVDLAHDGYQLRQALDLHGGGALFRDTFDQYGPLGPHLNLVGFSLFGESLLAIKHFVALWYGLTAILMFALARQYLGPFLSVVSVLLWLLTAPFYQHGIMISPHAYALAFQVGAMLWLIRARDEGPSFTGFVVVGALGGMSWLLKQSLGSLFLAAVAGYAVTTALRSGTSKRVVVSRVAGLAVGCGAILVAAFAYLVSQDALADWYRQTVQFPRVFYLRLAAGTDWPMLAAAREFARLQWNAEAFWLILRGVILAGGAVAVVRWRTSADRKLLLGAWVTGLLWLAAFPSGNFMHQWWTVSPTLCVGVCVIHAAWTRLTGGRAPWTATVATLVVVAALALNPVDARIRDAAARASALTATIAEPPRLAGIHTRPETAAAFSALYREFESYRAQHPDAPLISIDSSDGVIGIAQSLPVLSFVNDRPHRSPVYWSLPVLSTVVYPSYAESVADFAHARGAVLADSPVPRAVRGYRVLATETLPSGQLTLHVPDARATDGTPLVAILADADRPRDLPQRQYRYVAEADSGARRLAILYAGPFVDGFPEHVPGVAPIASDGVSLNDPIVRVASAGWAVAGHVDAPAGYLLQVPPRPVPAGACLVATGVLVEGGLTLGLLRDGAWAGFVNVTQPGWFVAAVGVPEDGDYEVVLANNLPTRESAWTRILRGLGVWRVLPSLRPWNEFHVQRVGWSDVGACGTGQPQ